jgi:hypothetical protein
MFVYPYGGEAEKLLISIMILYVFGLKQGRSDIAQAILHTVQLCPVEFYNFTINIPELNELQLDCFPSGKNLVLDKALFN